MSKRRKRSRRTIATDISPKVREEVKRRDKWCIFCGRQGHQICHVISRGRGGLGKPQNLVFGCVECHMKMDQSAYSKEYTDKAWSYLESIYGPLDKSRLVFKK